MADTTTEAASTMNTGEISAATCAESPGVQDEQKYADKQPPCPHGNASDVVNDDGGGTRTEDSTSVDNSGASPNSQGAGVEENRPYYVKWVMWKGVRTAIVTQNDNGPCPLLAIINILLLRRAIEFPTMQEMVTTSQLMEYLGDHVLQEMPQNLTEGVQRNFEQNMQDALSILPKLKTGLDVNVKFSGVADFEFTPERGIFDLLNIHLYHGWLVDPQSSEYKKVVASSSYNQLVEKIVASQAEETGSDLTTEGLIAETFLQETANQLTYHGLCELYSQVKDDELCVFFRNNHFSTLYKYEKQLYILLTDQGFLTEDKIVWQSLSNVDGDGEFVDSNFNKTLKPGNDTTSSAAVRQPSLSQEDQDYMLALSIQTEQQSGNTTSAAVNTQSQQHGAAPVTVAQQQPSSPPRQATAQQQQQQQQPAEQRSAVFDPNQQELFDLQYAMQLQEQENQRADVEPGRPPERRQPPPLLQQQQPPPQSGNVAQYDQPESNGSSKKCAIL